MNDSTSFGILELGPLHGHQHEIVHMNTCQTWSLFCFHVVLHAEAMLTWNTADLSNRGDGRGTEVLADLSSRLQKNQELFVLSFATWCRAVECGQFCMQMNGGKLVMRLKADVGSVTVHDEDPDSEPLTSFDVTHPGLAAVKVERFWQLTSHFNVRKRERRETA